MTDALLFIDWNVNPEAFSAGPLSIKWYGVMWGLSLFSCFFLASYLFKKLNKDIEKVTLIIQYIFIFGLIGARLAHVIFYGWNFYMAHPQDIIAVWKGGLASHGGVVGGLIGLYIFCKRNKDYTFFWTLDIGIISTLLLASLIRFGNLLNSELYGKPTDVAWAFVFKQVDNIPRHPVVLYESIAYFLIQLLMLALFKIYKDSRPGLYIATYLILVFGTRFMLEFYKDAEGAMLGPISKTQALNLPFIFTGIVLAGLVAQGKLHYAKATNG